MGSPGLYTLDGHRAVSCSMTGELALEEEGELDDLKAFFSLSRNTILGF